MKSSRLFATVIALAALAASAPVHAQGAAPNDTARESNSWQIDASHSELSFRIRHFVSKVRGTFGSWKGTIIADPAQLDGGRVDIVIDAKSIDTNHERRDADLRSEQFFEVEKYPEITFASRSIQLNGTELTIVGDLTMRGVTRPVTLTGEYIGMTTDNRGRRRIGFEARTKVNRVDWGITWNRLAEGGGAMLGDDVEIEVVLAAVQN
jgi:polyisoprenoid-binding protein YceI